MRLLVALCLPLWLLGCVQDTPGYCEADVDCPADQACSLPAHACVDGPRRPTTCQKSSECAVNQLCLATRCVEATARAELSGSQQVPPTASIDRGTLLLYLEPGNTSMAYDLRHTTQDTMAIHVHDGRMGESGPVLFTLPMGNEVSNRFDIAADQITALSAGGYYVDVHTRSFPTGEVRGQIFSLIQPSPLTQLFAVLSPQQAAPPVPSRAVGRAQVSYDDRTGEVVYSATHNLDNVVDGIHIHRGGVNENGPHLIDLPTRTESSISGKLTRDQVYKSELALYGLMIKSGLAYLNFHTAPRPGGELRGQLLPYQMTPLSYPLPFNVTLEGAQVAPPVNTGTSGVLQLFLSPVVNNAARLNMRLTHTAPNATAAHIHRGASGQNGVILCSLSSGLDRGQSGCDVRATPQANELPLTELLAGGLYIDVHTQGQPNGELRGQILVPKPPN